jgi:predicted DNA-binding transcriptional regulator YafY
MARYPGRAYKTPDFDPLLAVHRIAKIELTERNFEYPKNFSFEACFNSNFGVIKEKPFDVEMEFNGWATTYASERKWSAEQKIIKNPNGAVRLKFKTASALETISLALSFRDGCRIIKPKWLRQDAVNVLNNMKEKYRAL